MYTYLCGNFIRHIMKREVNQKSVPWALVFTVSFIISVFVLSEFSLTVPIILLIITINPLLLVYSFQNGSTDDKYNKG